MTEDLRARLQRRLPGLFAVVAQAESPLQPSRNSAPGSGLQSAPRSSPAPIKAKGFECAAADLWTMTLIEDAGATATASSDDLSKAAFEMLWARSLCDSGRVDEAHEVYQGVSTFIDP